MVVAPSGEGAPLVGVVRARVVSLAADALGRLEQDQLPASLRRVAAFAPSRRARLAATAIAAVLAHDEDFRSRVADKVRQEAPDVARAIEGEPASVAAADPVEVAALAYLLRPPDWEQTVAAATELVESERRSASLADDSQHADRLRRRLETVAEELKEARRRHREQTSALRAENTELRQRLAQARARVREVEATTERRAAELAAASEALAAQAGRHEAELRRLRTRAQAAERDLADARGAGRAERGEETLRARLLLDTLLATAQGLRRELALPPVEGSPADAVEAHQAQEGARRTTNVGSLSPADPALLDQLLALPRAHLVVDGYNVTKTAWPQLPLERQRHRLLTGLAPLAARSGAEVTVVFDAADVVERPLVTRPRGVRVLFSPLGVIADDVVRELVAAEPQGRPVVVVSSDQEVARDVARGGARVVAAPALSRLLERA